MTTKSSDPLATMPPTRRQILQHIKRTGESRTEELATALGISLQGSRQQLTALERDGLVEHREERDGAGRPKYVYALTESADALFPRRYADLTNELLDYVRDEDPELVARIFDRRAQRRLEQARRRTEGLSFSDRVRVVAEILDEDGYLADFQRCEDGTFLITEHNCAVLSVAKRYTHACGSELAFLQAAMPEAEVIRIAHRINSAHA